MYGMIVVWDRLDNLMLDYSDLNMGSLSLAKFCRVNKSLRSFSFFVVNTSGDAGYFAAKVGNHVSAMACRYEEGLGEGLDQSMPSTGDPTTDTGIILKKKVSVHMLLYIHHRL